MKTKTQDVCHIQSEFVLLWQKKVKKPLFIPSQVRDDEVSALVEAAANLLLHRQRTRQLLSRVSFHLHAAVGHRHGVVGQRVAGHLAVVGAADGGQGAHVTGGEGISLVGPEEMRAAGASVGGLGRLPTG